MENLIVRYAEKCELTAVNVIRRQVNDLHVNGRPDIFRADGWQYIAPLINTRFEDSENGGVIVAVLNGGIVGFATVQYIVKPASPYGLERRFYRIEEFGVDEDHRRMGIATALIDFAKKDAKERGFDKIELDMWEFNETALAFYESMGFRTYRRYMETDAEE